MYTIKKIITLCTIFLVAFSVYAETISREQIKGLDEQVQEIKKDVLGISSELNLLEEKLLYPSNTQVSVFVSVAKNSNYSPDAIQISIDNKKVAHHIYSYKEVDALRRGGVQRIYTGNVLTGDHKLDISLIGKVDGSSNKNNKSTVTINKGIGPKLVEISVGAGGSEIKVKEQ